MQNKTMYALLCVPSEDVTKGLVDSKCSILFGGSRYNHITNAMVIVLATGLL